MSEERREYTIYKWFCKDLSVKEVYIGMTINFKQRKKGHKGACTLPSNDKYNQSKYVFIRKHGAYCNWDYQILEKVYGLKSEAKIRETMYIENCKNCLNEIRSVQTKQSAEQKRLYNKKRYEENKEELLNGMRNYYINNKEKILDYHKNYRNVNKEIIKEKSKKRYEEAKKRNPEKFKERSREQYKRHAGIKVSCKYCSATITRTSMKRHQSRTICKTVQFALPYDPDIHKMCSVCDTKILIKGKEFMHNCQFEIEFDNKPLKKKRKL